MNRILFALAAAAALQARAAPCRRSTRMNRILVALAAAAVLAVPARR